ncbi:MAG: hypothetical protein ACR2I1_04895 [Propionibacteriaceae bacterium]
MMEFFDIAAVVYFLRKVIWIVPDFITSGCADSSYASTRASATKARSSRSRPGS